MSQFLPGISRKFINVKRERCNSTSLFSRMETKTEYKCSSNNLVNKNSSYDPLLKRLEVRVNSPKFAKGKIFLCNICGQKFSTAFNTNRHRKSCNPSGKFRCSRCPLGFSSRSDVASHVVRSHWVQCSKCSSRFPSKKQLSKHCESHNQRCPMCAKQFQTRRSLQRHLRIHTKRFLCVLCKMRFSTKYELQVHMKAHKDERPYKCGSCSCSFLKPSGLNGHMKVHTNSKTSLTAPNSNKYPGGEIY